MVRSGLAVSKIWLLASRPKTWIASISPIVLGTALSMTDGYFSPILFLFTLVTGLGIQISTNLANDYFDCIRGADTADREGPTRVTQAGWVSKAAMRRAIYLSCLFTALSGCYLAIAGGPLIGGLVALAILLGLAYTAGPYPIAYIGLSEVFVIFFFGSLATAGTYFLQVGVWSFDAWIVGCSPGLLSSAILVVNNLRDHQQDRAIHKKTLVVRFGIWFGRCEYLVFILCALAIPLLFAPTHPFALLSLLALPPSLPLIVTIFKENTPSKIDAILPKTGRLLFFYTLLLCVGWML